MNVFAATCVDSVICGAIAKIMFCQHPGGSSSSASSGGENLWKRLDLIKKNHRKSLLSEARPQRSAQQAPSQGSHRDSDLAKGCHLKLQNLEAVEFVETG